MQYILSHEEMDELQGKIRDQELMPSKKELQKFCTKIANEVSVKSGWAKDKIWGCILNKKSDEPAWYCDECPAKSVCPYEYKTYSQ